MAIAEKMQIIYIVKNPVWFLKNLKDYNFKIYGWYVFSYLPINGPPVIKSVFSSHLSPWVDEEETGAHKRLERCWDCFNAVRVFIRIHLSKNLYIISLSYLCLIFFCLHLTTFCGNLSLRIVPQMVVHLSFATCFSIWLLYRFTFHFLSLYPLPLSSSHSILPVATVKVSRRLAGSSFIGFF